MASVTMTVPDEVVPRVAQAARAALLADYGEDATGFTDAQAVKRWTRYSWIEGVSRFEAGSAWQDSKDQAEEDLEGIA